MSYITTTHRFIIDDRHPADVFDEIENFFSLYTVAIDDLQQVSIQLTVPSNLGIHANKQCHQAYQQLVKAIRYTVPDVHILPVTEMTATEADGDNDNSESGNDANTAYLMIQRYNGVTELEEDKLSLYQRTLGKLMPKFASDKTDTGLYPEVRAEHAPLPIPIPTPLSTPPIAAPIHTPPVMAPQPHAVAPTVATAPSHVMPQMQRTPPITKADKTDFKRLPHIQKTVKPYQDMLTQAIILEAKRQQTALGNHPIRHITLKSSDSLTTAMIEQLFYSFNHSKDKTQTAHDAIDLVSYGYEVLKPALANIGIALAEDAQFGLKTKANATPAATNRLQAGEVFANEIRLAVRLKTHVSI